VGEPHRWKAPRVAGSASSSRSGARSGLGVAEEGVTRERGVGIRGATAGSEVRLVREHAAERCHAPTRVSPPKRVGRRETPGSSVFWSRVRARAPRARRKPRRDADNARGAGARSQEVGSRSRSYASRSCSGASRKADPGQHELARSKSSRR